MNASLARAIALYLAVSVGAAGALNPASARAQADGGFTLAVRAQANVDARCFEVEALRQRIAHYSAVSLEGVEELQLELYVKALRSAELHVYRGAELVARRRFEKLPIACADRRDAVALSIALALDGLLQELAPAGERDDSGEPDNSGERDDSGKRSGSVDRSQNAELTPTSEREPATPVAAAQPEPPPAETEITSEADEPESRPSESENAPELGPSSPPFLKLHAGGRWLAEALPSPVWTGALGVELWFNRQIAIDGSAMASTSGDSRLAGGRAQTSLIGGELLGCAAQRFGSFVAQGCVGPVAAACRASGGRTYPVEFPAATALWLAGTARLALRWPDEQPVSVRLVVQGHVSAFRPELRVYGSREALSAAPLGASAGLDVVVSLE